MVAQGTTTSPAPLPPADGLTFAQSATRVLETVSERSRRAYDRALQDFLQCYTSTGQPELSKATVQAHITDLQEQDVTASSINQRLGSSHSADCHIGDDEQQANEDIRGSKQLDGYHVAPHALCS